MDREAEAYQGSPAETVSRGDLFWIGADESRGSIPGHQHPYVVIQDDVLNHSRISTVVVCAISSNLNKSKELGNVLLELAEGNLSKQSVVVVSQISCLYKARLGERIGALSSQRVEQILAGMRFQQTSFFNRK